MTQTDGPRWQDHPAADQTQIDRVIIALAAGAVLALILLARGNTNKEGNPWPMHGPNDRSRWATVYSLAERGTYDIDETPWPPSIDRVRLDGHFYSSKPPLLPTLLAGEYLALKALSFGTLSFEHTPQAVIRAIVATVNWVPFVIFLVLYSRLLHRFHLSPWVHSYAMATAAGGTFLTGFCVTLNNHTIAAFSCFFGLFPVLIVWWDNRRDGWLYAVAGFFAAFTAVNEFPAATFSFALFLALAWKSLIRTLAFFVPVALIPLAAHFATNYLVTGDFKPAYLKTEAYVFDGSYWKVDPETGRLVGSDPKGIDNQNEAWPVYLFHMVLGHHGIFSLSPVFFFTAFGLLYAVREREPALKLLAGLTCALTLAMLMFYTFGAPRNYGGMSCGLRWLFWLVPLWLVFLPGGLERKSSGSGIRWMAIVCLGISALSAFYATRNPWTRPWLHELLHSVGWIPY